MRRLPVFLLLLVPLSGFAEWDDMATAAATGYCLASHPYRTIHPGRYTPDGFEIVARPGVVGAVRRNFIFDRTRKDDEGLHNSCADACGEFGRFYPGLRGVPLTQQVAGGHVITSGLGDIASLTQSDYDFYLQQEATVGIWSRGNTWHESNVAQADFCCCQAVYP